MLGWNPKFTFLVGVELAQLGDESLSLTISYLESIIAPFYSQTCDDIEPVKTTEAEDANMEPALLLQYRYFLQRVYLNLKEPLLQIKNPKQINYLTLNTKECFDTNVLFGY